jgi:hypothetical protein
MARAVISDPKRRAAGEPLYVKDPQSGASIEVFLADPVLAKSFCMGGGWFWWSCLPGCLPVTAPHGPFATNYGAFRDALARGSKPTQFGRRITRCLTKP